MIHKMAMIVAFAVMVSVIGVSAYAEIPEEVRVGSLLPLTGGYSSVGVQVDAATQLAIDDFNAYLEEMGAGWQFVLTREDSASNPVISLEKIHALHTGGSDIVFGPAGSERVASVKNYVDSNNMLVLSCCSTSPAISIPGDRIFRIVADDFNQGLALGKLLEHRGIDAIVTIHIGDTYGDGLIGAATAHFMSRGGIVSENGIRYHPDIREFSAPVSALANEVRRYVDVYGADRVAVVVVAFREIVSILQAADNYPVLKRVHWFGSETIAQSGHVVNDRIASAFANEAGLSTVQLLLSTGYKADHVAKALADEFGDSPHAFVYTGYDAVWLAGLSILEAGSAHPSDIAMVLPDVAAGYSGALSNTQLNENGDLAMTNYQIWTISDTRWVSGETYYMDTDTIVGVAPNKMKTPSVTSGVIIVDGAEFALDFTITGGDVLAMHTDPQNSMLVVDIDSMQDGSLTIDIPRALIDSRTTGDVDGAFFVLVNGDKVNFEEVGFFEDSRTLRIDFPGGATKIEIIGTSAAVPEFGVTTVITLSPVYTNDELSITIQFPEGWIVQHVGGEGLPDVTATRTTTSSTLPASIAVYVDNAGTYTFDSMVESKIRNVQELAEAGDIIIENQELSVLGERKALVTDVSLTETIGDTDFKIREVTVMDLPTNTIYTFLFSASVADFERSLTQFDETLQTFDVITVGGDVIVLYEETDDPIYYGLRTWLTDNEDTIIDADSITGYLTLHSDIHVVFELCGQANAWYYKVSGQITMCYELADQYTDIFRESDIDTPYGVANALHWVFMHELGHAVVDMYDLPIAGQEEDAADQFATIMLLREGTEGAYALLSIVHVYAASPDYTPHWSTHSFNLQRYYNMLCLLYGKHQDDYIGVFVEGLIPESRAIRCADEYRSAADAWSVLLSDYIIGPG